MEPDQILDPVTGFFRRAAFDRRIAELEAQSERVLEPVAVIVGDVDGGAAQDPVLGELADRWRGSLRAYDLVYRLEDARFVVLLPGAAEDRAQELAEQLRISAGAAGRAAGTASLTMSLGVASSAEGEAFRWATVGAAADAALRRAAGGGGNAVAAAPQLPTR